MYIDIAIIDNKLFEFKINSAFFTKDRVKRNGSYSFSGCFRQVKNNEMGTLPSDFTNLLQNYVILIKIRSPKTDDLIQWLAKFPSNEENVRVTHGLFKNRGILFHHSQPTAHFAKPVR